MLRTRNTTSQLIACKKVMASSGFRVLAKLFFGESGQPLRMSGTVVDVTLSKLAEAKAIQLRDAGIESRQSYYAAGSVECH